ncbi:MAG: hypothetical protein IT364_22650 [Candidatus Hydrogenedentes bacterium]|nr:hypothetical protein [Candidatus Hydrogenedentota bacterium]
MRTVLTVVGITLAVVITAVAGVYAWMAVSATQPSQGLPAPPPKVAKASRETPARPHNTVAPPAAATAVPRTPSPSKELVRPAPSPLPAPAAPTQDVPAVPDPNAPAHVPETPSQPPVDAPPPATMFDKLAALRIGSAESEVAAIMGTEGAPVADAAPAEFVPQGWYNLRWNDPDGGSIVALFTADGILAHLEPLKVVGAFDWMNADPFYSITAWINDNLENESFPVRLPAVEVTTTGEHAFRYQGSLVTSAGQFVGSMRGAYYAGDGATTYMPNDRVPYKKAIEGVFEFIAPDGSRRSDNFAWVEH